MSTRSDSPTPQSDMVDANYLTVASTSSTASRADSIADNDVMYSSIYDSGTKVRSPEIDQENQVIPKFFIIFFAFLQFLLLIKKN